MRWTATPTRSRKWAGRKAPAAAHGAKAYDDREGEDVEQEDDFAYYDEPGFIKGGLGL